MEEFNFNNIYSNGSKKYSVRNQWLNEEGVATPIVERGRDGNSNGLTREGWQLPGYEN